MSTKKRDLKGPYRSRAQQRLYDNQTNLYKQLETRAGGYHKTHVIKLNPPKKDGAADGR